jgi:hypothetical protein
VVQYLGTPPDDHTRLFGSNLHLQLLGATLLHVWFAKASVK